MAPVTCTRCFAVFEARPGRPGAAPLCEACAGVSAVAPVPPAVPPSRPTAHPAPVRPAAASPRVAPRRLLLAIGGGLAAVALLAAGGLALRAALRPPPAPPPPPSAAERAADAWRAAGLVPARPPPAERDVIAERHLGAARAALAADLPARDAEALDEARRALAAAPDRADAVAAFVTAFAATVGDETSGQDLELAHDLVREALARAPARPDLLAAYARLLLAVPSRSNQAEALAVSRRALVAAPREPGARLAAGLALAGGDAGAAAAALSIAADEAPEDRRLLTAAARARWVAGDAEGALALAARRLALDADHPDALALAVEIETAAARYDAARAAMLRWAAARPGDAEPHLLLARLAYQVDGDPAAARRHLDDALSRTPDDFLAARILAHRAAVERAAGDLAAARAAVDAALARVTASGPARFQASLLAWQAGDARAARESAGVVAARGGPVVQALLAARVAELAGTDEELERAYLALAAAAPRDPDVLLSAAGALARMRLSGAALRVAAQALARDPLEGRLRRGPTDYWEGPAPLLAAARALGDLPRAEPRAARTAHAAAAASALAVGQTQAAERHAAAAREASPQSAVPLALLAQVALDRGQPARALAFARAAVDLGGGEAALAVHARALAASGKAEEAAAAWRAALEACPDLATARLEVARLRAAAGDAAGAREALLALLRDDPGVAAAQGALLDLGATPAAAPPGD
jgi:tetratricopeptide (TPR) repeat protein